MVIQVGHDVRLGQGVKPAARQPLPADSPDVLRRGMLGSPRFWHMAGVDVVDCGDIHLFMMVDDNLYNICVAEDRRGASLERHYAEIASSGYRRAPVDRGSVREARQPRFVLYKVVDHFLRHSPGFTFFDIGAFVGDISIRYANYCRTVGGDCLFECFDPTIAGDLIPFNADLNGLGNLVHRNPFAISNIDGPIAFLQRTGHSDSNSSSLGPGMKNTVVLSVRLSSILSQHGAPATIIKLDTENLEPTILNDCKEFIEQEVNALCIEANLTTPGLFDALEHLSRTHLLWDIGYVPKPFRARRVVSVSDVMSEIQSLPYGYTDLLAVSKSAPAIDELTKDIAFVEDGAVGYSLTY